MKRRAPEEQIHLDILQYLHATLPSAWVIQHTPNKPRSKVQGAREKRMGAIAGWPDLAVYGRIYRDDGDTAGEPFVCFFEVKAPGSYPEPHQRACHDRLLDCGWKTAVVRSVDDVRRWAWNWSLPVADATLEADITGRVSKAKARAA